MPRPVRLRPQFRRDGVERGALAVRRARRDWCRSRRSVRPPETDRRRRRGCRAARKDRPARHAPCVFSAAVCGSDRARPAACPAAPRQARHCAGHRAAASDSGDGRRRRSRLRRAAAPIGSRGIAPWLRASAWLAGIGGIEAGIAGAGRGRRREGAGGAELRLRERRPCALLEARRLARIGLQVRRQRIGIEHAVCARAGTPPSATQAAKAPVQARARSASREASSDASRCTSGPQPPMVRRRTRRAHDGAHARGNGGKWLTEVKGAWLTRRCRPLARQNGLNPAFELAADHVADHRHAAARLSLRQGMAAKFSPPACLKISAFSMAISSSVSRQSAEKPGVMTARFFTPLFGQRLHRRIGIGLEPFGRAEARLEGHASACSSSSLSLSRSSRVVSAQWQ